MNKTPRIYKTCQPFNKDITDFSVVIDGQIYPKIRPLYQNKSINFDCLNKENTDKKTILLWTSFRGDPLPEYSMAENGVSLEDFNCPVTNCEITFDRKKYDESSLVAFHLRNKMTWPLYRKPNQRWVHLIYESPVHCPKCVTRNRLFNFGATYTRNSDLTPIYLTESGLYWQDSLKPTQPTDVFELHKTSKFSAALTSNCDASYRSVYLGELKKYISLDIYGRCGDYKCLSAIDDSRSNEIECRKYISENYKFFFAFENSVCRDYITEKLFDTIKFNVVPIVLGGGDYSYWLPKSGYINALDFDSPKALANYLIKLSGDKVAYNKFFEWKHYLKVEDQNVPEQAYLCEMCIKLNLEETNGVFESKLLGNMQSLYGMKQNCAGMTQNFTFTYGENLEQKHPQSVE